MSTEPWRAQLEAALWPRGQSPDGGCVYAILDAARHHLIHPTLNTLGLKDTCLHESDCAPDVEEVGAHLIPLKPGDETTDWVLSNAPGNNWGILIRSQEAPATLRDHLKSLLQAELPDGAVVWFRYYDPRVLRVFLPTCTAEERRDFFGPVERLYFMDNQVDEDGPPNVTVEGPEVIKAADPSSGAEGS